MCIAILKPEGIKLYDSTLENCWYANSDGAGFMYAESGKLHIKKGFFTLSDFLEAYKPHEEKKCVIHFRIRTHGDIDEENCHPYSVDKNLAFIHNGIINEVQGDDKTKSDTWYLNQHYFKHFRKYDKSFFLKTHYQNMIDKFIGYSKLVFLNSKGQHAIINERAGNWDSGVWFSNNSWKTTNYSKHLVKKKDPTPSYYMDDDDFNYTGYPIKVKNEELASGMVCWLNTSVGPFKYGEYVAIKYIYTDHTAGIYDTSNPKKEGRVPIAFLTRTSITGKEARLKDTDIMASPDIKIGDIVMFTRNYNHFRRLDDVIVVGVSNHQVTVQSDPTEKTYNVPYNVIKNLFDTTAEEREPLQCLV